MLLIHSRRRWSVSVAAYFNGKAIFPALNSELRSVNVSRFFHQSFIRALRFLVHSFTEAVVNVPIVISRNSQDNSAATRFFPWCRPMIRNNSQSSTLPNSPVALGSLNSAESHRLPKNRFDLLQPVRRWLDEIEVQDRNRARFLSKVIPAQCPFERDIKVFGYLVAHIPPLCKLNPLYDQLVGLRFRALCYLVDQCGEDIQSYA